MSSVGVPCTCTRRGHGACPPSGRRSSENGSAPRNRLDSSVAARVDVGEHGVERGEVGVDVGDEGVAHQRVPVASDEGAVGPNLGMKVPSYHESPLRATSSVRVR